MKLPELKQLMKQNDFKGYSLMNKKEIIELLVEKGVISEEQTSVKNEKKNPKHERLIGIRNNPKSVEIRNLETDVCNIYPSIYKAGRALNHSNIKGYNGKVWQGKYEIKIK